MAGLGRIFDVDSGPLVDISEFGRHSPASLAAFLGADLTLG
jgi:hypothetical protein